MRRQATKFGEDLLRPCKHCGAQLPERVEVCPNCGASAREIALHSATESAPPPRATIARPFHPIKSIRPGHRGRSVVDLNGAREWGLSRGGALILFGFAVAFGSYVSITQHDEAEVRWRAIVDRAKLRAIPPDAAKSTAPGPLVSASPSEDNTSLPRIEHSQNILSARDNEPDQESTANQTIAPMVRQNPSVSAASVSPKPGVAAAASVSPKPGFAAASVSPSPSVSSTAGVSPKASVPATSGVSPKPSVAAAASVSPKPSFSAVASVSPKPSFSAAASVSPNASVSAAASVSPKPGVAAASVSPSPSVAVASVSPKLGVAAASVSPGPSVSATAGVSPKASVPATAGVSPKPSVAAAASVSPKPRALATASVSPKPSVPARADVSRKPRPAATAGVSPIPNRTRASQPRLEQASNLQQSPGVHAHPHGKALRVANTSAGICDKRHPLTCAHRQVDKVDKAEDVATMHPGKTEPKPSRESGTREPSRVAAVPEPSRSAVSMPTPSGALKKAPAPEPTSDATQEPLVTASSPTERRGFALFDRSIYRGH
jgi:hypothetical protein